MNLYTVTIRTEEMGRNTYHVSAKDARSALDKAYEKCWKELKHYPGTNHMYVIYLELQQENW